MTAAATVGVVVPCRNAAAYLGEALRSVVEQSACALDVVVVDDGSDDESAEIATAFGPPVRCVRQAKIGVAAARNRGVAAATGAFLTFLDADDLWTPQRMVSALAALERPNADAAFGRVEEFVCPRLTPAESARLSARSGGRGLLPGAMLIRREAFERVGAFDTTLRTGEFLDWHARARETGLRETWVDEVWLRRRLHASNHTRHLSPEERLDYVKAIKRALDRRRLLS